MVFLEVSVRNYCKIYINSNSRFFMSVYFLNLGLLKCWYVFELYFK